MITLGFDGFDPGGLGGSPQAVCCRARVRGVTTTSSLRKKWAAMERKLKLLPKLKLQQRLRLRLKKKPKRNPKVVKKKRWRLKRLRNLNLIIPKLFFLFP